MTPPVPTRQGRPSRRAGLTLVELIVAFSILLVLSTMALPMTKMKVQREKERRLRMALEEIRTAIDRYKDAADAGLLGEADPDNHGYPESLDVLVEGVQVSAGGAGGMGAMGGPAGMGGMGGMQQGGMGGMGGMQQGGMGGMGGRGGGGFGAQGGQGFGGNRGGAGGFGSRGGSSKTGATGSRGGFGARGGQGGDEDEGEKKMRFLRKIPTDPITGRAEWGMRSVSDSPDSMSWGGKNVFDVFSMSMDTALDGTRYSEW